MNKGGRPGVCEALAAHFAVLGVNRQLLFAAVGEK
jgi:hypothetical protein